MIESKCVNATAHPLTRSDTRRLAKSSVLLRASVAIVILAILTACSGNTSTEIPPHLVEMENLTVIEADAEPTHEWNLVRAASYGDTDEVMIGQMGQFTVGANGEVYIADRNQNVIHAYSPDGEYLSRIGNEGSGPGEFRQINAIRTFYGHLHVLDSGHLRISRFDLDTRQFVDDISVPFEFEMVGGYVSYPGDFDIVDSDNYLIHFGTGFTSGAEGEDKKPKNHGNLLDRNSATFLDGTVYEFPISEAIVHREGGSMSMMRPDYKRQSMIMMNSNYIVHSWSEELLFSFYGMDGEYSHAFWQPFDQPPLNRNDILEEYADRGEPWRGMIRNDEMPETWPAFKHSVVDDENRIWAATYIEDEGNYSWRVFSSDGELLSSFIWPRSSDIRHIRNGSIYAREVDEETGLDQIVRYRIEIS
ncbi:MAG: 6-bladed beta-propeller [Balneolaceae bacterium]|nr:6-bladed beta-propeller [Balneolaceae bacterium]MCH8550021.1 6-bladed beta-propeller [Balneolaceae bacterium]